MARRSSSTMTSWPQIQSNIHIVYQDWLEQFAAEFPGLYCRRKTGSWDLDYAKIRTVFSSIFEEVTNSYLIPYWHQGRRTSLIRSNRFSLSTLNREANNGWHVSLVKWQWMHSRPGYEGQIEQEYIDDIHLKSCKDQGSRWRLGISVRSERERR